MAVSDKLQSILDSKAAIKAAIEAKGVADVGDVLANYPDKIASIQTGGGSSTGFTGHADVEGLKAIGWTDDDIAYYQSYGVNWNEEDDEYHKVPEDNIALYGVLTADNIQDYKDILVYCPKIDTSGRTSLANLFQKCFSLVAIPMLDTSSVTNISYMFHYCYSLVSVPQFDTKSVTSMSNMFHYCYSLVAVPQFNTSSVTNMGYMFSTCYSLTSVPLFDTSSVTSMSNMFDNCRSLTSVPLLDTSSVTNISSIFNYCYSIQTANMQNLKKSLDISMTSLLIKESLLYIINNEAATSPITITLSAYCYNKYNTDEEVTAALANHPNVSLASV